MYAPSEILGWKNLRTCSKDMASESSRMRGPNTALRLQADGSERQWSSGMRKRYVKSLVMSILCVARPSEVNVLVNSSFSISRAWFHENMFETLKCLQCSQLKETLAYSKKPFWATWWHVELSYAKNWLTIRLFVVSFAIYDRRFSAQYRLSMFFWWDACPEHPYTQLATSHVQSGLAGLRYLLSNKSFATIGQTSREVKNVL